MAIALLVPGCSLIDLSKLTEGSGGAAATSASASSTVVASSGSSDACANVTCSTHGHCEETGGAHCVCDSHFDGADCSACSAPYVGGECLACAMGYQDENDDGTCAPACNPTTCSGHGACDDASFFVDTGNDEIVLCPDACTRIRTDATASISVNVPCVTVIE